MKYFPLKALAGLVLAVTAVSAAEAQGDLTTPKQKVGYSIGMNIGGNLSQQGLKDEVDVAAMIAGLQDGMSGSKPKMAVEEMQKAIQQLQAQLQAKAQAQMEKQSKASKDFLAKNATAPGVKTTASGLQYLVMTESKDPKAAKPKATDTVKVHYHGTMIDGTVFDSSVQRGEPATFPLDGVIPGWTEGLQLMKVGDKYKFFVPAELAYGDQGAGPIAPNSTLIFEVELLGIEKPEAPAKASAPAATKKAK